MGKDMNMKKILFPAVLLLVGCAGIPKGIRPVQNFELDRYLGKWYEIARLDHSFERGLERVSAEYNLREKGGIRVLNRGYQREKGEWKEAEGRAYFTGPSDVGRLKVSFFRPFYGGYNIIELDPDYTFAIVCGGSRKYLWILSREPEMEESLYESLVKKAKALDFPTEDLIRVRH